MFVKCIESSRALKAISSVFDFAEKPKDTVLRQVQFFVCQRTVSICIPAEFGGDLVHVHLYVVIRWQVSSCLLVLLLSRSFRDRSEKWWKAFGKY